MSVYCIAQISITNRDIYNRYQARFMDVFQKFKGQVLAADEKPQVVEGEWHHQKIILLKFPDQKSFEDWANSPDYQEIAKDRKSGSEGIVLLVKSIV
jgi:uncharacterized protein (DUF1330 family)